jgi:dTDP-4-amino-4,6-dideoxygalactose transaminase
MYCHGEEEIEAAARVLRTDNWFRYGSAEAGHLGQAAGLETEWADTIGIGHAGFVSSGTAALMCCCAGLGIGPGDEFIVPGYTWIASASAPTTMGAIPVIVDIDDSLTLDPEAVEAAITPRTKAVIPVHMMGLACDLDKLRAVCDKHGLVLIEDACQCDGGYWTEGRRIGTIGDMSAFSFNQFKVIGCGDSGIYVTDDETRYQRAQIFHDAGIAFRDHASDLNVPMFSGLNLRGNEILAAIMRVQVSRINGIVDDLMKNHKAVSEKTADVPGLRPIRYNGSEGVGTRTGTGATLGYRFEIEEEARSFFQGFKDNLSTVNGGGFLPIDSGRHVYSNWEGIMKKRVWHTDAMNPFNHPANAESNTEYTPDMLPKTLEVLKTTVFLNVSPDWNEAQVEEVAAAITAAAGLQVAKLPS